MIFYYEKLNYHVKILCLSLFLYYYWRHELTYIPTISANGYCYFSLVNSNLSYFSSPVPTPLCGIENKIDLNSERDVYNTAIPTSFYACVVCPSRELLSCLVNSKNKKINRACFWFCFIIKLIKCLIKCLTDQLSWV